MSRGGRKLFFYVQFLFLIENEYVSVIKYCQ